ncbi:MAG: type II 3-dehydroquinate dehydratase, partial [Alphaproteobacteria bacterium]|nr:type II 3-dehydroquinate dehydratase [Alphaproteobacteria bacterium]
MPIYVLNGPNLNLLGQREPDIYGRTTLAKIGQMMAERAKTHGLSIVFRQSNHEGELIDWIQEARIKSAGMIINGGAYSHTSLALHDALRSLDRPLVEVHLSNPFAREEFRHHSRLSPVAKGVIVGFGAQSY